MSVANAQVGAIAAIEIETDVSAMVGARIARKERRMHAAASSVRRVAIALPVSLGPMGSDPMVSAKKDRLATDRVRAATWTSSAATSKVVRHVNRESRVRQGSRRQISRSASPDRRCRKARKVNVAVAAAIDAADVTVDRARARLLRSLPVRRWTDIRKQSFRPWNRNRLSLR